MNFSLLRSFFVEVSQNLFNLLNGIGGVIQCDLIIFLGVPYGFSCQPLGEFSRSFELPGFFVLGAQVEAKHQNNEHNRDRSGRFQEYIPVESTFARLV